MNVQLTMELDIECGLDFPDIVPLMDAIEKYFETRQYGNGIDRIVIIAICRPESLRLETRRQFDKKRSSIYCDVKVDFEAVLEIQDVTRKKQLFHEYVKNAIICITYYKNKFPAFDFDKLSNDWKAFFWEYSWW